MSKYEDRGMMKYAPYQSLIEQSASLRKLRYNKNKKEKTTYAPTNGMKRIFHYTNI